MTTQVTAKKNAAGKIIYYADGKRLKSKKAAIEALIGNVNRNELTILENYIAGNGIETTAPPTVKVDISIFIEKVEGLDSHCVKMCRQFNKATEAIEYAKLLANSDMDFRMARIDTLDGKKIAFLHKRDKRSEVKIEIAEDAKLETGAEVEKAETAPQNFSISLPKKDFSETAIENLKAILASKANLIKSALKIENCNVEVSENELKFDWFKEKLSADAITAYTDFILKVAELAKKQKRVTAKEREVVNERYAFRCFLLRIGLIGSEFKNTRKILLEKLVGNCAFKIGHR